MLGLENNALPLVNLYMGRPKSHKLGTSKLATTVQYLLRENYIINNCMRYKLIYTDNIY